MAEPYVVPCTCGKMTFPFKHRPTCPRLITMKIGLCGDCGGLGKTPKLDNCATCSGNGYRQ